MDKKKLNYEGKYKNGKKDGIWRAYFQNGDLAFEGRYRNGVLDGPSMTFDEDGIHHSEGDFKNGKKEGLWEYYEGRHTVRTVNFKNGKKNGPSREYYKDFFLKSETNYKDDVKHGYYEYRDHNDVIVEKGMYKNGRPQGPWLFRKEDESKRGKYNFDDGFFHKGDAPYISTSLCLDDGYIIECQRYMSDEAKYGDRKTLEEMVDIDELHSRSLSSSLSPSPVVTRRRANARSSIPVARPRSIPSALPPSRSPSRSQSVTSQKRPKKLSKKDEKNIKEHKYNVEKLKNLLRERNMPLSGNKMIIEARLLALNE
jgi:antitoxin component YwqK of YwqJK toxin-antitoxin module